MNLAPLKKKLGYEFNNISLLMLALRHRSLGKDCNERLEFLGDAVLNFVIAAELFTSCPEMKEGELSRVRANLVNSEILLALAQEFELGDFIQVGAAELKTGVLQQSILADSVEAIIGAIYIDGGFEAAKQRIVSWYKGRLQPGKFTVKKDSKTMLQELMQSRYHSLPLYLVIKIDGVSHAQTFHVECSVPGVEFKIIGVGPSKRKAEQDAAEKFLAQLTSRG